jgi:Tol biopolymer transport system component
MRIRILAVSIVVLSAVVRTAGQNGSDLYQQGLARETAGDIKGAVQIFERIVRDSSSNRTLTARALVKLGEWSDLLGQDARSYYERVVREFADQPGEADLVAQAKSRLTALVRTPAGAAVGMTVRPLPEVSDQTTPLAVSPDGAKAIVWDFSKGQNIALYDFSKKQTRLLTDIDWVPGLIWFAVWSPDTRRVAYTFARYRPFESELRVTTLDGRSSLVYRADGYLSVQPVGWTPDGATLVIVLQRPDKTWSLGTLPATGGQFTPLRSLGWAYDYRDATPRLSPDGRFLAFLEGEKGVRDVHVVSLDGREAYRITDDPADDLAPIWSPDSRHLAFTSTRFGSVSLWTTEIKDGKAVGQPVRLKDGMQSTEAIDWTERGIFYSQKTRTWDLYTLPMDPVEGRPAGSPRPIAYSRTGRNLRPVWSPDGERLAFVSSTALEPNRRYVVVMPAGGGQAREFLIPTTTWFRDYSPNDLRWFGDGRGLGFSGTDTRGVPAVFRLLLETGEWSTIPFPSWGGPTWTAWNADGSAFYFFSGEPPAGIVERSVNGGADRLVYRSTGPSYIQSLEFSPDHKWLAFFQGTYGDNNETSRILIANVKTGETRTVIEEVFSVTDPGRLQLQSWTSVGDLLIARLKFSATGTTTASKALLVPVNGGAPQSIVLPIISPSRPGEAPDFSAKWSPDGRSMVLGRVSQGSETFVIENPLAAVRATTGSR